MVYWNSPTPRPRGRPPGMSLVHHHRTKGETPEVRRGAKRCVGTGPDPGEVLGGRRECRGRRRRGAFRTSPPTKFHPLCRGAEARVVLEKEVVGISGDQGFFSQSRPVHSSGPVVQAGTGPEPGGPLTTRGVSPEDGD